MRSRVYLSSLPLFIEAINFERIVLSDWALAQIYIIQKEISCSFFDRVQQNFRKLDNFLNFRKIQNYSGWARSVRHISASALSRGESGGLLILIIFLLLKNVDKIIKSHVLFCFYIYYSIWFYFQYKGNFFWGNSIKLV